jgi:ABC-type antimicrobial peptide transport system permease subunit
MVVTVFSFIGLLMAAIGTYGLIHYSVATRTQEIGLRMAIGAQRRDIFRTIIREGIELSLIGLLIGVPTALLIGQAGSSFLFGVSALDPITLVSVTLTLTALAALACYFPARRAMNVDPIVALRQM